MQRSISGRYLQRFSYANFFFVKFDFFAQIFGLKNSTRIANNLNSNLIHFQKLNFHTRDESLLTIPDTRTRTVLFGCFWYIECSVIVRANLLFVCNCLNRLCRQTQKEVGNVIRCKFCATNQVCAFIGRRIRKKKKHVLTSLSAKTNWSKRITVILLIHFRSDQMRFKEKTSNRTRMEANSAARVQFVWSSVNRVGEYFDTLKVCDGRYCFIFLCGRWKIYSRVGKNASEHNSSNACVQLKLHLILFLAETKKKTNHHLYCNVCMRLAIRCARTPTNHVRVWYLVHIYYGFINLLYLDQ